MAQHTCKLCSRDAALRVDELQSELRDLPAALQDTAVHRHNDAP
jgi:hypothetical protein